MQSAATFAVLSGWPIVATFALMIVAGALSRRPHLLALVCMVVLGLLVFWAYALGRLL